ncbi:MAG: class II aldolase/adducin family protein [Bacilli bacterium]
MAIEILSHRDEDPLISNIIRAGHKLVEEKLIVRTWGNISQRIDENNYYITPSGRDYTTLEQGDMVKMRIKDNYVYDQGKPSSEYKIHREIYNRFKDVNFIIHTHQDYGSALSLLGLSQIKIKSKLMGLGQNILFADYGLPGSDRLAKNVAKELKKVKGNAIILKNHGVICFGKSFEEAFAAAKELELVARQVLINRGITEQVIHKLPSADVGIDNDGRYFVWDNTSLAMKVSSLEPRLKPYIDDFAQIVGMEISTDSLKGILCQSNSLADLEAIFAIVNKNCLSYLASRTSKTGKPISKKDCLLMRDNYINNYSKLK